MIKLLNSLKYEKANGIFAFTLSEKVMDCIITLVEISFPEYCQCFLKTSWFYEMKNNTAAEK